MAGAVSRRFWHACPSVRPDRVGDYAPHPSRIYRNRPRSAQPAKRHVLGAYGLDLSRHGTKSAGDGVQRYSPDLVRDPYPAFPRQILLRDANVVAGVVFSRSAAGQMVLWGIFLRTVLGWHFTWLVNSATHLWGKRRFETRDDSRNNGFIAAVTFGEGWHNNHHAYPRSARHGLTWREIRRQLDPDPDSWKCSASSRTFTHTTSRTSDEAAKELKKAA